MDGAELKAILDTINDGFCAVGLKVERLESAFHAHKEVCAGLFNKIEMDKRLSAQKEEIQCKEGEKAAELKKWAGRGVIAFIALSIAANAWQMIQEILVKLIGHK